MIGVVCVLVVQGLLVTGFPVELSEIDEPSTADDTTSSPAILAQSIAESNDTDPASDFVTFSGSYGIQQEAIPEPSTTISENSENEIINLSDTLVNEPKIIDTILAEKDEKINQTLAIADELVDLELEKIDNELKHEPPKISTDKTDSDIPDLMEMKFNIESELLIIKDSIESELETTRRQIRSAVLENKDVVETNPETVKPEKEIAPNKVAIQSLIDLETNTGAFNAATEYNEWELALIEKQEEIEAKITNMDALIDSELAKIDSFVESELAKTEALIKFEIDKVNLFVESKFKPSDSFELESDEVESNEEAEIATEVPVEGVVRFNGIVPASGRTLILGSAGYTPIFPVSEQNVECVTEEAKADTAETVVTEEAKADTAESVVEEVKFTGIVPVFGRTMIFGSTGFLHPNLTPLRVPSKIIEESPKMIPISVESGPVDLENIEPPPPVSRETNNSDFAKNFQMVSKFSPEFPETIIMDATKNYERLIEYCEVNETDSFNGDAISVVGEVFFEGTAPAFGTVSITGRC